MGIVLFVLLIPVLLYIPFVQDFAKDIAVSQVEKSTGWDVKVDRLRLRWPLRLSVDGVCVVTTPGDTMLSGKRLDVGVALMPLFKGDVQVNYARLDSGFYQLGTADSLMWLRARLDKFELDKSNLTFSFDKIDLGQALLSGADISLVLHPDTVPSPTDTTTSPMLITAKRINLRNVNFAMRLDPTIDTLQCSVPEATLLDGRIDMAARRINAASLAVDGVTARYLYPRNPEPVPEVPVDTVPSEPWLITAQKLHLSARDALYAVTGAKPVPGLDMDYLQVSGVRIDISNFSNRGMEISVPITLLEATERCGLHVNAHGLFAMDSTRMRVSDFTLLTDHSRLEANAVMAMGSALDINANARGSIGFGDVLSAFPSMRPTLAVLPSPRSVTLDIDAAANDNDVNIRRGVVSYPGFADLKLSGQVRNYNNMKRLFADIAIDGALRGTKRLPPKLLAKYIGSDLSLPDRMTVKGTVKYSSPANVTANLAATANNGRAAVKGTFSMGAERYNANLKLDAFPVDAFMPNLGIGAVTATLTAVGNGFDPARTRAASKIDLEVAKLAYRGNNLSPVSLHATLADRHARGVLNSAVPDADVNIDFDANFAPDSYSWDVAGDVRHLDLHALGLSDSTLGGTLQLTTTGTYNPKNGDISAVANIDTASILLNSLQLTAGPTAMDVTLTGDSVHASLQNGDLTALLIARSSLQDILSRISGVQTLIDHQIANRSINVDSLQRALPNMSLFVAGGTNNLITQFLDTENLNFNTIGLTFTNDSLIHLSGQLTGLKTQTMAIDTVTLTGVQRGHFLTYNAHIGNRPGTLDDFARVWVNGYLGDQRLTALLRQENIKGETGYRLGAMLTAQDSTVTMRLMPYNPVIAYKQWNVNSDNFISYNFLGKRLEADLSVSDAASSIRLYTVKSEVDTIGDNRDLMVDISKVNIQDWLSIIPSPPPFAGILSANLRLNLSNDYATAIGRVNLADLAYENNRMGTFDLNLDMRTNPASRQFEANAWLAVDSAKILTLHGVAESDTTGAPPLRVDLTLDRLPLSIANPFLPKDVAQLSGYLSGKMDVLRPFSPTLTPGINGYLRFDSAAVNVGMLGQMYHIASDPIPVDSNIVHFNDLAITGANSNPLTVGGSLDLKKLSDIGLDIALKARDMMLVNSSKSRGAEVFGKASIDADASVRGKLGGILQVDADLTLLSGSSLTYILPGGETTVSQLSSSNNQMVKFVNFNDTTRVQQADSVAMAMAMILEANLNIQDGTQLTVDLSTDGHNRVQLQGSGNFTFTMNPVNSGRLTGRYTIQKGFVRYTPPMLSEKLFDFEEGSYVAFNGDMLNPILNIHAVDHLKANVTQTGQNSRLVTFDIGLSVTNTLQNMNVAFDLSTDDDITVQNELAGMTPEQRASQAINMLLYNVYSGPGTKGNASLGGNILFSFLESKINSWAASAIPGVDLSFGIEQYDRTFDGSTSTTTSYSYRLSKSFADDRIKIIVGGNYSTDADTDENFSENLINDISFEYLLNRAGSMYIRIFRHTGFESILEGEITQTGVGFVMRRKLNSLRDLFRFGHRSNSSTSTPRPPLKTTAQE